MSHRTAHRLPLLKLTRPLFALTLACVAALASACSAPAGSDPSADPALPSAGASAVGGAASAAGAGGAGTPALNPLGRARCRAPVGVSASPQNTEEAVQLLNSLPKPTGSACFIESLDRPLAIYATDSMFSAQPAFSRISPRVFIKLGALWVSAVMDGDSSYLLEFGTQVADAPPRSIKGELLLPINAAIPTSAPYDRVREENEGTVCGLCHAAETRADNIAFAVAFSSASLRPRPDSQVSVDDLRSEAARCDWQLEPHRCEMLAAVFGGGSVVDAQFPDGMPTFF
ncbi:MAG: hypothetical protein ABJB12_02230 [Pseudomonadota bacterium]